MRVSPITKSLPAKIFMEPLLLLLRVSPITKPLLAKIFTEPLLLFLQPIGVEYLGTCDNS